MLRVFQSEDDNNNIENNISRRGTQSDYVENGNRGDEEAYENRGDEEVFNRAGDGCLRSRSQLQRLIIVNDSRDDDVGTTNSGGNVDASGFDLRDNR